uniref:Retrotransposon gag domain-containing protein n=1 Tax=Cannabis sativa TaxID=3483 RepID=A0A803PU70_CANSA
MIKWAKPTWICPSRSYLGSVLAQSSTFDGSSPEDTSGIMRPEGKSVEDSWKRLSPRSIHNWRDLQVMFKKQFIAAKDYDLEASSLISAKQQQGESLKKFIQHMMDVVAKTKTGYNAAPKQMNQKLEDPESNITHSRSKRSMKGPNQSDSTKKGKTQESRIQAPSAEALQGAPNAPAVAIVVAPVLENSYPLRDALLALDGHVEIILGGPHIVKSTQNAQKHYLNELNQGEACHFVQSPAQHLRMMNLPMTFIEDDTRHVHFPHNDPLVIEAQIASKRVSGILMDNGSSVNIIFKGSFHAIGLVEANLLPSSMLKVPQLYQKHRDHQRRSMNIRGNPEDELDPRIGVERVIELMEEVEEVSIDDKDPTKVILVGKNLPPVVKEQVVSTIKANNDVLA